MRINAIPTMRKGVQYRSRLEARWAAFFDFLGWRVEYEPFDRDGWIPDFVILGKKTVLVEVKPVLDENDPLFKTTQSEINRNIDGNEEALIVSWHLPHSPSWLFDENPCVGWLRDENETYKLEDGSLLEGGGCWDLAPFGSWTGTDNLGFCHAHNAYSDRINGGYDGGCWGSGPHFGKVKDLVGDLWARAGNEVQWRRP